MRPMHEDRSGYAGTAYGRGRQAGSRADTVARRPQAVRHRAFATRLLIAQQRISCTPEHEQTSWHPDLLVNDRGAYSSG